MLTQSAAGTGWVNERDPTVALGPGNGNQPLNHTPVIEKFGKKFLQKIFIQLCLLFYEFSKLPIALLWLWFWVPWHLFLFYQLVVTAFLSYDYGHPAISVSKQTNTVNLIFFLVLQLNSIYFPFENSEQNNLPFVLTKTSFRVEPSQT